MKVFADSLAIDPFYVRAVSITDAPGVGALSRPLKVATIVMTEGTVLTATEEAGMALLAQLAPKTEGNHAS